MLKTVLLVITAIFCLHAENIQSKGYTYIKLDNDFFKLYEVTPNTDEGYTNGLFFGARFNIPDKPIEQKLYSGIIMASRGFEAGQKIYTPRILDPENDPSLSNIPAGERYNYWKKAYYPNDYKYSGTSYISLIDEVYFNSLLFPFQDPGTLDVFIPTQKVLLALTFGTTGKSSLAGPVQKGFHHLIREWVGGDTTEPFDPVGWDSSDVVIDDAVIFNVDISSELDLFVLESPCKCIPHLTSQLLGGGNYGSLEQSAHVGARINLYSFFTDRIKVRKIDSKAHKEFSIHFYVQNKYYYILYNRNYDNKMYNDPDRMKRDKGQNHFTIGGQISLWHIQFYHEFTWSSHLTKKGNPTSPAGRNLYHKYGTFGINLLF
ncbi:MAG: lipid A deacylase LpxR family protein [Fibrobacterales bacterium]